MPENVGNNAEDERQQNGQNAQNNIIGREEQESISLNHGERDDEKVINLVRNKWGINDTTVSFNIVNHEGNIYRVSVNSKETTEVKAWYEVNLSTGEVTE